MSDHLLRLAKIVAAIAGETLDWKDTSAGDAVQLVRDLEAEAAKPAPERRTITRAEYWKGRDIIMRLDLGLHQTTDALVKAWRLTVEDA